MPELQAKNSVFLGEADSLYTSQTRVCVNRLFLESVSLQYRIDPLDIMENTLHKSWVVGVYSLRYDTNIKGSVAPEILLDLEKVNDRT